MQKVPGDLVLWRMMDFVLCGLGSPDGLDLHAVLQLHAVRPCVMRDFGCALQQLESGSGGGGSC
jgi:hypothetical protein